MICLRSWLLSFLLFFMSMAGAQSQTPLTKSPPADWADEIEVDPASESPEGSGAYHYLVADRQDNLGETATYFHVAVRLFNEEGVKDFAQLNFDFQQAYEKLQFHHLRIIRDGVVQERLSGSEFEIIQREERMDDELYDGERTAHTIIDDVRPGDILSYAYTRIGRNPVLPENQQEFARLEFGSPVGILRRRVLWDPDQFQLRWKIHGPQSSNQNKVKETPGMIEWVSENAPAPDVEDDTPGDFFDYSWLEWSTFKDWAEAGEWELQLYTISESLPEEMVAVCDEIRASASSGEDEIVRALRWVQRNIRYLGSFIDEHTHAPHSIDQIVRRRFGDCKDKSMLLTAMLGYLGHDAAPALVNTYRRSAIIDYLPGHSAFDHLIVHVRHQDKDHYIDPTHTYQRGRLNDLSLPSYGYAFVVRPGESALRKIEPNGRDVNKFHIEEIYKIESATGGATLEIVTVATGAEANSLRRDFAEDSLADLSKMYLEFYEFYWSGIETGSPMAFEDDEEENRITIREHYRIPEFWTVPDSGDGEWTAKVTAGYLKTALKYPDQQKRAHPYDIVGGKNITQVIDVTYPEQWPTDEEIVKIEHPAFSYDSKILARKDGYRAVYKYSSLLSEVSAENFDSYRKKVREIFDDLSIYLSNGRGAEAAPANRSDFAYLLVGASAAFGIILGGFLSVLMYLHDPDPRLARPGAPQGLDGWMILPVIGTALTPMLTGYALWTFFSGLGDMGAVLEGESGLGVWRGYYASGAFLHGLLLLPGFILVYLLTKRRTNFPIYYTAVLGADLVLAVILLIQEFGIEDLDPPADLSEPVGYIVPLAIWGSYMFLSERVKATFVQRRKPALPPPIPGTNPPVLPG